MNVNRANAFYAAGFLAIAIFSLSSTASAGSGGPVLDVYIANISPSPVEPGQNFLLNILLKNSGGETSKNTTALLNAKYPFTLKTIQNDVSGGNICADCTSSIIYALSVDASSISGSYPIEFEVSYGSDTTRIKSTKTVNVDVIGVPRITFEGTTTSKITPKSQFDVELTFRNIGTGSARNIKISTASEDFVIAGGSPVIASIPAGGTQKITVSFISGSDISPNIYSIPLSLSYTDELGASKESTLSFGLSVLGNSDLIVKNVKIEPMPVPPGKEFTVTVRVQNIGYGDAKEVVMELDAPYSGYKKAFIGKLGRDEDAPAIFNLKADAMDSNAKLTIRYRDDFGEHEKTENIAINVAKLSDSIIYYVAIAIAAIILLAYRKRISMSAKGQSQMALYSRGPTGE